MLQFSTITIISMTEMIENVIRSSL